MNAQPPAQTCVRHPNRPTGLACTRCGRPSCPDCLRPAAVGQHCVDCLRQDRRDVRPVRTVAGAAVARNPVPFVTYALIAVNVVVFAITAAQSRNLVANTEGSSLYWRWVLVPQAVADGQWVRLIGSGFLHYGPIHLLLNMFALYVVGRSIEPVLGRLRYLAVYLVALLGGSAAVMVFSQDARTAGASCAVYGLFGAITVVMLRVKQSPNQMLILIGINVFISFSLPGISLAGHLGGLLAGTLATLGILFLPEWSHTKSQESARLIGWLAVTAVAIAALGVIVATAVSLA